MLTRRELWASYTTDQLRRFHALLAQMRAELPVSPIYDPDRRACDTRLQEIADLIRERATASDADRT